jgi:hypothetical protein
VARDGTRHEPEPGPIVDHECLHEPPPPVLTSLETLWGQVKTLRRRTSTPRRRPSMRHWQRLRYDPADVGAVLTAWRSTASRGSTRAVRTLVHACRSAVSRSVVSQSTTRSGVTGAWAW